jgi:hypothetical protein
VTTHLTAPAVDVALQIGNAGSTPEGPDAAMRRVNVMTSTKAWTGRRFGRLGRLAAMGVVVLTLAGAAASPAAAMDRGGAAYAAGWSATFCGAGGGDAYTYDFGDAFVTVCAFDDSSITWVDPYDE